VRFTAKPDGFAAQRTLDAGLVFPHPSVILMPFSSKNFSQGCKGPLLPSFAPGSAASVSGNLFLNL